MNAVFDMSEKDDLIGLFENGNRGHELIGDIDAICIVINHFLNDWLCCFTVYTVIFENFNIFQLMVFNSYQKSQMKKAGQSFLKRVIAVAVLFLLPYIVELILELIDMFGVNTNCVDPSSI